MEREKEKAEDLNAQISLDPRLSAMQIRMNKSRKLIGSQHKGYSQHLRYLISAQSSLSDGTRERQKT